MKKLYLMKNLLGMVKIGISNNPATRKRQIELNSGVRVEIIDVWNEEYLGMTALEAERTLHSALKHKRYEGEWFHPDVANDFEPKQIISSYQRKVNSKISGSFSVDIQIHKKTKSTVKQKNNETRTSKNITKLRKTNSALTQKNSELNIEIKRLKKELSRLSISEQVDIQERVKDTKKKMKSEGRYLGGKVPYGFYVKDGYLDEDQQAVIAVVQELRKEGMPLRKVAKEVGLSVPTVMKLEKVL